VILGPWIGSEYARAGLAQQAEQIQSTIAPMVDGKNAEQVAYGLYLQGEIALIKGDTDKAIQLFSVSDNENSTPFSKEALARAYQQSGNLPRAVTLYEKYIASPNHGLLDEPQQRWLAAHCTLAADYQAQGDLVKAREVLTPLLLLWKDADQDLPLRKQAVALNERLR
jgi:lipopolysaccharide biosynthesis regulator YciM